MRSTTYTMPRPQRLGVGSAALAVALMFAVLLAPPTARGTAAGPGGPVAGVAQPNDPPDPVQDFQDVPTASTFYTYLHNLYVDGIISGYPCGGPGEPCVAPDNLPYYRPNATVSRQQMTKFVDLGRRDIAVAVGQSLSLTGSPGAALTVSATLSNAIFAYSASGNDTIHSECTRAGTACYALHSVARTGDYSAYLTGGRGAYVESDDSTYPAVNAVGYGTTAPGGEFYSPNYRSAVIDAPASSTGYVQLAVNGVGPTAYAERIFNGGLNVEGNLTVGGSKSGYVVDAMQNADTVALEPGDVVIIAGDSAPAVIGQIPAARIMRAASAYDTRVVGIVDQALYVPDSATQAAYTAQETARADAMRRRAEAEAAATREGDKPDPTALEIPPALITDARGLVHAVADATEIAPGGYANVVTLGSYKMVKVDASYGAIQAGDLLTTSPHAGYAMKVTDKAQAMGAVIGKALGSLDAGTGTIAVLVTLK